MSKKDLDKTELVTARSHKTGNNKSVILVAALAVVIGFAFGWVMKSQGSLPPCNCKRKCAAAVAQAKKAMPPPPKCLKCKQCVKKPASKKLRKLSKIERQAHELLDVWEPQCKATARPEFLNQSMCLRWTKLGKSYLKADILDEKKLMRRRIAMIVYDKLGKMICAKKKLGLDKVSKAKINKELASLVSNRAGNMDRIRRANVRLIKAGKKPVKIPDVRNCYFLKEGIGGKWVWLYERPKIMD